MIKRRLFSYYLAFALTFSGMLLPYREAKAIVPLAAVAVAIVDAAGSILAADILTSVGTAILGGIAMAAILYTPGDNPVDPATGAVRVPLNSNTPAAAMPPPSVPSDTSMVTQYYATAGGGYASSPYAACQAYLDASSSPCYSYAIVSAPSGNGTCYYDSTYHYGGSCTGAPDGTVFRQSVGIASVSSCPSGYVVSGSSCVLSNPRAAVADKKYDYGRSGTTVVDPGTTGEKDTKPVNTTITNGSGYVWGKDANGNPVVTTITPSANGGSTIQTQTQVGNQVLTKTYTTAGDGTITAVSGASATGSVGASTGAGVAPVVTTGTASTPVDINFPTDYARQGEAAAAAATVSNSVKDLKDSFLKTSATPDAPALPDAGTLDALFFKDTFKPLFSWSVPGHSSTCPTANIDYNLFGKDVRLKLDAQCSIAEQIRGTLSGVMVVVFEIIAIFIILGA